MVQVDLITGFLGAGKTTFLRRYAAYLTAQGHHVCILENDFGAVNVDAMLVQDLLGERCEIETISGGCDCDTHQRRPSTFCHRKPPAPDASCSPAVSWPPRPSGKAPSIT